MTQNYSKYYGKNQKKYSKTTDKNKIVVSKDKRDEAEAEKLDKSIFGILLAILAILPLITRTKIIDFSSPLITNSSIGSGTVGDVFTYYKFIFLVISTTILLILFLYRTFGIGIPLKKSFINIPLAILALTVTLSAVFAPYKSLALLGMYNRHEGALTYLCYFALFFIAANLTYTKKMLLNVVYALYPVTIVNTILGLLAFYGVELINYGFVRALLLPSGISEEAISSGSRFITTINHGNYVSGISAVLLVIFMMMFILDKNKIRQAVNGLFAILAFAMMLSSLAQSGFVTLVVMVPIIVLVILRSQEKLKSYGKLVAQLAIFAAIFVVLANHNPKVWDESIGFFISENPFAKEEQAVSIAETSIVSEGNLVIEEQGISSGNTVVSDNNLVEEEQAKGLMTSINNSHNTTELNSENNPIMNEATLNQYTKFIADQANKFSFVSLAHAEKQKEAESFQLPQLPESGVGAGSGRLFIWDNTFNLIKQRPILGHGLDTFIYHFPQNDPEKIANLWDYKVIVDKPHNLYLNIAYGSGAIALLAFIILLTIHFSKNAKMVISRKINCETNIVFFSLFVGWIAYLVQALFNDSVIGSAPIFWIIMGALVSSIINQEKVNGNL